MTVSPSSAPEPIGSEEGLWRPTPLESLELAEIPTDQHFIRDHFPAPACDPVSWSLEVIGSSRSLVLDLPALRGLQRRTWRVVLECAGHRRDEFDPVPPGVPWSAGAVGEARWTGASLSAVLELAGVRADAHEVVLEGADAGRFEDLPGIRHFARSLPLAKALDPDVLVAYEMNGEPIAVERGGPVRVIVPGWYATDSVKWLQRIWFTDREFDGAFQAHDYRLRVAGEAGPGRRMTTLPVNSLITSVRALSSGLVALRGIAWGGSGGIAQVLVSIDAGRWIPARFDGGRGTPARVDPPPAGYARVHWELRCELGVGRHEIASRAIDGAGLGQPERPEVNEGGYANSSVHRVRVQLPVAG